MTTTRTHQEHGRFAFRLVTGAGIGTVLAFAAFLSMRAGVFARRTSAEVTRPPELASGALLDGVLEVPSECASLERAIGLIPDGGTVRLEQGTFVGRISARGKSFTLRGAGPGATMVRGLGAGPVLEAFGDRDQRVVLEGIAFVGGQGTSGTGLLLDGLSFDVRDCRFAGNEGAGALLRAAWGSFSRCDFEGNRGGASGGALRNEAGRVEFAACTFRGNVSRTFGGAVFSAGGAVTARGCTFSDNATSSGAWGGAVYGDGAAITLDGSEFVRNRAIESGGAVYLMGGSGTVSGCTFSGNQSDEAKSIFSRGAFATVASSRLCGAEAASLGGDFRPGAGNVFDATCFGDCNQNGIGDSEEIAAGWAADRDGNGIPDACDPDCNGNGLPDGYEISAGFAQDANGNGMIDFCEIRAGLAADADGDWVPDDAQQAAVAKAPASADSDAPAAAEAVEAPAVTPTERASWGPGVRRPRWMREGTGGR